MISSHTSSDLLNRRTLVGLAIIPTVDSICNQLNNALKIEIGSFSLLQAMRSIFLVIFILIIVRALLRNWTNITRIPIPALGAVLILGMAASKELIVTGVLSMSSIGAYGQMAYWILLWATVSILCRTAEQGEIILRGLALGAILTAASVILGFVVGTTNYYRSDAVNSSAGWFDTAKMITGLLIVGGIVILYLGRKKRSWLSSIAAGFCFLACILTYARAGTVALGVVLIWFVVWRFIIARRSEGPWLNRFLIMLTCACILVPVTTNLSTLLYRWNDMSDSSTGGSGRATFWKVSVDYYMTENEPAQIFGIGYNGMSEMLLRNYGDDIKHTHNDMFDMLLVNGFIGGIWLVVLMCAFVRRACLFSIKSIEGASAIAIVLVYICHSQLTGQIWGTDSMTYYTLSLTGLITVVQNRSVSHVIVKPAFHPCEAIA